MRAGTTYHPTRPALFTDHALRRFGERFPGADHAACYRRAVETKRRPGSGGRADVYLCDYDTGALFVVETRDGGRTWFVRTVLIHDHYIGQTARY